MYQYRINQNQVNNSRLSLLRTLNVTGEMLDSNTICYHQRIRHSQGESRCRLNPDHEFQAQDLGRPSENMHHETLSNDGVQQD
ncbi:unnamed protein product [Caretta caretta]